MPEANFFSNKMAIDLDMFGTLKKKLDWQQCEGQLDRHKINAWAVNVVYQDREGQTLTKQVHM